MDKPAQGVRPRKRRAGEPARPDRLEASSIILDVVAFDGARAAFEKVGLGLFVGGIRSFFELGVDHVLAAAWRSGLVWLRAMFSVTVTVTSGWRRTFTSCRPSVLIGLYESDHRAFDAARAFGVDGVGHVATGTDP